MRTEISRPGTLSELAKASQSLEEFGYNLRDWQHEVRDKWRGKRDFFRRIEKEPELLQDKFAEGNLADAYLGAYAQWLADQVGVSRVNWANNKKRILDNPWFAGPKRASLLRDAPPHFIERNIFTNPDDSFLKRRIWKAKTSLCQRVRKNSGLTQEQMAKFLGVGIGTIRNWEQGRNQATGPAKILLEVFEKHPELVFKAHPKAPQIRRRP